MAKFTFLRRWAGALGRQITDLGWWNVPIFIFAVLFFAFGVPMLREGRSQNFAMQRKANIFVLKQGRFRQPQKNAVVFPKTRAKSVAIPDPVPDDPQLIRPEELKDAELSDADQLPEVFFLADCALTIPEPPPAPPRARDEEELPILRPLPRGSKQRLPLRFVAGGSITEPRRISGPSPVYAKAARRSRISGVVIIECVIDQRGALAETKVLRSLPLGLTEAALDAVRQWRFEPATLNGQPVAVRYIISVPFKYDSGVGDIKAQIAQRHPIVQIGDDVAREFFSARRDLSGISFQEPRGYWKNTYIPYNRVARAQRLRLEDWDRSSIASDGRVPLLHDAASSAAQPYDPPTAAALSIFLHSDLRGLDSRQRLLVEVGLKATARHRGRASTMNVGLVLDRGEGVTIENAVAMRAMIEAFVATHYFGDRFSLVIAGPGGGLVVTASEFRHGPVSLSLRDAFEVSPKGRELGLISALELAAETILAEDDPSAPLGSTALVLITSRKLDEISKLTEFAHKTAVLGAPTNVIAIGEGIDLSQLDTLVLAGQGRRLVLGQAGDAPALADTLLRAVSRTVARAVRLNIRLAAGVQLIDIIGSKRLDEYRADQIREAEQAIDQRLAYNLGIEADRGLDEDGIQIVIPAFYAGDDHVILLDLVAPGPGAIVDVTAHYKDLVHMKNGVGRAHLSLGRDRNEPGPLELNVVKNLLCYELGSALERAALSLEAGNATKARDILSRARVLLEQAPMIHIAFDTDTDIENLVVLADEYLRVLSDTKAKKTPTRDLLCDSMRYAAHVIRMPYVDRSA